MLGFLSRIHTATRYYLLRPSSTFQFPFLYLHSSPSTETNNRQEIDAIDERRVLSELSDLLPMSLNHSVPNPFKENGPAKQRDNSSSGTVDGFLSPEEKLRGVFLQNLNGKAAVELALSNVDVELSLDLVSKVVDRGNLGGEAMVLFFNWAIKQPSVSVDVCSYNVLVKALGRRKFFDYMVRVLHEMVDNGVSFSLETLYIVIDSFVRAHRVNRAIEMFENLEVFGMKCDTESLNVVLRCLCRRLHVGAANSLLDSMRGKIEFNVVTYDVIIGGWSRLGRVVEVERVLKEMVDGGLNPGSSIYRSLIECLGRCGRVDDAVKVFNAMKENGCGLDTNAYNAMICNYISVRDFEESMKYYKAMLSDGCDPNEDTYTRLISGFLKVRRVADALELFEEMLDKRIVPSTGTITSSIEQLCSYGPPHAAMMMYKQARKAGSKVSLSAYKLLFMRLSRFGKCGMLLHLWQEMQESGYSTDGEVYEYVISGLCTVGQLENAVLVMEEALSKGFCPSRLIYSKLSNKLLASDDLERACKLYSKVKVARHNTNVQRYWRSKGWHF